MNPGALLTGSRKTAVEFAKIDILALLSMCAEIKDADDFSIEHKTPWLHSEDPGGLFFDIQQHSFLQEL